MTAIAARKAEGTKVVFFCLPGPGCCTGVGIATDGICVRGQLKERWQNWGGGMRITVESESEDSPIITLTGIVDQASSQGLLRRLYSLGLPLISVN